MTTNETNVQRAVRLRLAYDADKTMSNTVVKAWLDAEGELTTDEYIDYQNQYRPQRKT